MMALPLAVPVAHAMQLALALPVARALARALALAMAVALAVAQAEALAVARATARALALALALRARSAQRAMHANNSTFNSVHVVLALFNRSCCSSSRLWAGNAGQRGCQHCCGRVGRALHAHEQALQSLDDTGTVFLRRSLSRASTTNCYCCCQRRALLNLLPIRSPPSPNLRSPLASSTG